MRSVRCKKVRFIIRVVAGGCSWGWLGGDTEVGEYFADDEGGFYRGDYFHRSAAVGAVLHINIEDPFEEPGPGGAVTFWGARVLFMIDPCRWRDVFDLFAELFGDDLRATFGVGGEDVMVADEVNTWTGDNGSEAL